ncbi:MAG: DUF3352 domain-containing protein [Actinomycetota bacterium]|nr:DUF3352 domain-containing protein [Actinomycetota bacterium]
MSGNQWNGYGGEHGQHGSGAPQGGYRAPSPGAPQGGYAAPSTETLSSGSFDILGEPPRRRRGLRLAAAGTAAVLVLGTAGAVAWAASRLSGGGTQPEDVVPATALAYADVDFDPSAGQKVAILRFLRHFPEADVDGGDDADLRKELVELLVKEGDVAKVDFDREVKPWLGDRSGVALFRPSTGAQELRALVALQVRDEDAARAGLSSLAERNDQKLGIAFRDGYALLAQDQGTVDTFAAQAEEATLGSDEGYRADMAKVEGGGSIATAWADGAAIVKAFPDLAGAGSLLPARVPGQAGRYAMALRFESDVVELVTHAASGSNEVVKLDGPTGTIANAPDTTVAALELAGGGESVRTQWDKVLDQLASAGQDRAMVQEQLDGLERSYGISLPKDLETLLGSNILLALDRKGLVSGDVSVGARLTTDPAAASDLVTRTQRALTDMGAPFRLHQRRTEGGLVVSNTAGALGRLAERGTLGEDPSFRKVMPDVEDSQMSVYADLETLVAASGDKEASAEHIDAVGVTARLSGGSDVTMRVRVSVK